MHMERAVNTGFHGRERSLGNLTQQIVEDLGIAIVTGKYSQHKPFPIESVICEKYGASRSIVREAIKVLNAKGLLIARPRRGTSVRSEKDWNLLDPDVLYWMLNRRFSLSALMDLTRARLAIEPAAAAEAARTASPAQVDHIASCLERMKEAAQDELDPLEPEVAFHASILEASNNPFFQNMSPLIESALRFSIRFTKQKRRHRVASPEDHAQVFNAIRAGETEKASAVSHALLNRALKLMEAEEKARASKRAK
jgi:DNA-binding FadR family transcriptional regulator